MRRVKDLRLQAVMARIPGCGCACWRRAGGAGEYAGGARGFGGYGGEGDGCGAAGMDKSGEGQAALREYGAERFLPCSAEEFKWFTISWRNWGRRGQLGIEGPAGPLEGAK